MKKQNSLSFKQMKISRQKYAYHISKIFSKIFKVDQIIQIKESIKYLFLIMPSYQEFQEKDFLVLWILIQMVIQIRGSYSLDSLDCIVPISMRRRNSFLKFMISMEMASSPKMTYLLLWLHFLLLIFKIANSKLKANLRERVVVQITLINELKRLMR